jgi:AcrR family transcriptional regulator
VRDTATTKPGRPPAASGAPHGGDEVRASLLAAATRLFAELGPSRVSIRQIAAEAGVNHGLVHYYFGSKDGLLSAVLDSCARQIADELTQGDDPSHLYERDSATMRHARILGHLILGADDPASIQHDFPTQRLLVQHLEARGFGEEAARRRAAQVSALVLGWHLFGDFLATAAGVDPAGPTQEELLTDGVALLLG